MLSLKYHPSISDRPYNLRQTYPLRPDMQQPVPRWSLSSAKQLTYSVRFTRVVKHCSPSRRACTVPVIIELQHLKHPPQVHRHDRVPDLAPPPHPKPRVFDAAEVELPAVSPADPRPVAHVHLPDPVQEAAQKASSRVVRVLLQRVRAGQVEQVSGSAVDGCHASSMATAPVHDEGAAHSPPTEGDDMSCISCLGLGVLWPVKWNGEEPFEWQLRRIGKHCESSSYLIGTRVEFGPADVVALRRMDRKILERKLIKLYIGKHTVQTGWT